MATKEIPGGISIPLTTTKQDWLITGGGFVGIPSVALFLLFSADYSSTPLPITAIVLSLVPCAFIYMLSAGCGMLMFCIERMELDREEIRVKLGPVTVRRISTDSIQTVIFTEQGFGRHVSYVPVLVLSTETLDRIEKKGHRKIQKQWQLRERLVSLKLGTDTPEASAYAYYADRLPWIMLGSPKNLVSGFAEDRVEAFRRYLPNARFVVQRR